MMKTNNRETLSTLAEQDTGHKQSRDTVNIGHTRYRMKTNHRETMSTLGHKIQDEDKHSRDTVNITHTRYRMKINNRETLSTLGTQDTG